MNEVLFLFYAGSEGAAAPILTRTNPNRDQRQPKKISVESFSNNQLETCSSDNKGILPSSSREATPMATETMQLAEYVDEKGFFSGNPFVEVTKGIIHIYKRKCVEQCMPCALALIASRVKRRKLISNLIFTANERKSRKNCQRHCVCCRCRPHSIVTIC